MAPNSSLKSVKLQKTTLLWPQANGEVERQNCSLLKCLQIAHLEGKNWRTELLVRLTAYRATPHMTGTTPYYNYQVWPRSEIQTATAKERDSWCAR